MSSTNTPIKPDHIFDWSDTSKAKLEYALFIAVLCVLLKDKVWVLNEVDTALFKPNALRDEPANNNGGRHDKWLEEKEKHAEKTRKFLLDILFAGGCLRACLKYPSMARSEVDRELNRAPIVPGQSAIEDNFRSAMRLLKEKYSSNTSTDIDSMRTALQALNDKGPDKFHGLKRDYLSLLNDIFSAGGADKVSGAENRDWVFKAITNEEICKCVTFPLRMAKQDALTYEEIFEAVTRYLELCTMTDKDPYKSASGPRDVSANSATTTTAPHSSTGRSTLCTRCWSSDHLWPDCKATSCVACDNRLFPGEKMCRKWQSHSQPYRYFNDILPWKTHEDRRGNKSDYRSNKRSYENNHRDNKPTKFSKPNPPSETNGQKGAKAAKKKNKKAKGAAAGSEGVDDE
jgi:hypothetical protein